MILIREWPRSVFCCKQTAALMGVLDSSYCSLVFIGVEPIPLPLKKASQIIRSDHVSQCQGSDDCLVDGKDRKGNDNRTRQEPSIVLTRSSGTSRISPATLYSEYIKERKNYGCNGRDPRYGQRQVLNIVERCAIISSVSSIRELGSGSSTLRQPQDRSAVPAVG